MPCFMLFFRCLLYLYACLYACPCLCARVHLCALACLPVHLRAPMRARAHPCARLVVPDLPRGALPEAWGEVGTLLGLEPTRNYTAFLVTPFSTIQQGDTRLVTDGCSLHRFGPCLKLPLLYAG